MRRLLRLVPVMAVSLAAAGAVAAPAAASAPAVSLSPTSLTFGSQAIGTTSAAQTITATNTGTASLFFSNVDAQTLDFTIGDDGCIGTTLPAGDSCTVSVTFSPTTAGTQTADVVFTDNAANSPQDVPLTGTGTGTPAPLAIDTQGLTCTGGVCSLSSANTFVNNFFAIPFVATGGTPPYTWSGQAPAELTLTPAGELYGTPPATGTSTFTVTVTDAAGDTATGTFSLTVSPPPAPSPKTKGCKTLGTFTESLTGPAIGGKTPSGTATANETEFSSCGGYTLLTVTVKNVNLPDGTVLWVALSEVGAAGEITLSGGSGTMPQYNVGRFGLGDQTPAVQVAVYDSIPGTSPFQQILSGSSFG